MQKYQGKKSSSPFERGTDIEMLFALSEMDPELYRKCQDIIDELRKKPAAYFFLEPPEIEGYEKTIQTPMDLRTITEKLIERKYKSLKAFKSDVALIWSNAIKFNTEGSLIAMLADNCDKFFKKEMKKVEDRSLQTVTNECYAAMKKLDLALSEFPSDTYPGIHDFDTLKPIKRPDIDALSTLKNDLNEIKSPSQQFEIFMLLKQYAPEISVSGEINVDLSHISPEAIQALSKYLESHRNH